MRTILAIGVGMLIAAICGKVFAEETKETQSTKDITNKHGSNTFLVDGKLTDKLEATKAALAGAGEIYRCNPVYLSGNLTFKGRNTRSKK